MSHTRDTEEFEVTLFHMEETDNNSLFEILLSRVFPWWPEFPSFTHWVKIDFWHGPAHSGRNPLEGQPFEIIQKLFNKNDPV